MTKNSTTISHTKRQDIVSKESKSIPGPGQYTTKNKTIRSDGKKFMMSETYHDSPGKSSSMQIGPGSYDISGQKSGSSFKIQGRPKEQYVDRNLGPGTYDLNESQTKQRLLSPGKFSSSPPRDTSKSISPNRDSHMGPGLYDIRDYNQIVNTSISYSISKTDRKQQIDPNLGPGSYNVPCMIADIIPDDKRDMKYKYVGK